MRRINFRSPCVLSAILAMLLGAWLPADAASVAVVGGAGEVAIERTPPSAAQPAAPSPGLTMHANAAGAVTILVESVAVTGDSPTAIDNDFTRIDDAVQAVAALGDGTTIRLVGTFDWTEEHASASWAVADYAVFAPTGVADITIHALARGDAEIVGPGEIDDLEVYYEGFIVMWGGPYQGWTIENLVLRGFDWSIGMFYDGTEDFDGVTVRNNLIEVPPDIAGYYHADPAMWQGEPFQNIAIHLGFGENQTIEGNDIVIPGDAASDLSDPEAPRKASSVALQSNTSGGDAYDGLAIIDNTIRITGAQAEEPEVIYGIWENAHAHSADILISGNSFVNEHPDNDPALNVQRAFRVTSHSSDSTTVTYADNLVTGANIAIHWIGDGYTSRPVGVEPVVVEGNTLLGNDTGVWVHTDGLEEPDKAAAKVADPMSKAVVRYNRLVGNVVAVRSDNAEVTAENNWWGCSNGPGGAGCDDSFYDGFTGFLDGDPWLVLGVSIEDPVVDIGFGAGATGSVRANSDGDGLGAIPFADADFGFDAEGGSVSSPVASEDGAASTTFTATSQGLGSVTASLDNSTASVAVLVTDDGVVQVESVAETGDTPTLLDNDYTRINELVQMVDDDVTVELDGLFDWTESFAYIAWSYGSDGVADTGDDYAILAPPGFEDVTIRAATLGDAVILGPFDEPTNDWETFLMMWGGTYFGWTVENLDIRGFDWSIGMFFDSGADFHGVTIASNRIEMPADRPGNYGAGLGEPWQNVAIHLAGGFDQTIEGNEIIIPGDGLADTSNPEIPLKAASVAMQSNTHGGNRYDGLRIVDNTIRITGAQSADPEWVYGIWENGHAHDSAITVSGNDFINQHPGNDPALNLQRAFRVTSHSSDETTVIYADNLVSGANIGIHWIGDNYQSRPPSTVLPVVVQSNTLLGNHTGLWVHTDGLEAPDAPGAKVSGPMSKAFARFNRFAGNTVGLRSDNAEVEAIDNWWGCNEGPGGEGCDTAAYSGFTGFLDTDPWLVLGVTAVPDALGLGATSTTTATLRFDSDSVDTILDGAVADGTEIAFAATGGGVDPAAANTLLGDASTTYTAGMTPGTYQVSASLDQETVADVLTLIGDTDLSVGIDPDRQVVADGGAVALTVTVSNHGSYALTGIEVAVDFAAALVGTAWTCAGSGGGVCAASGSGDVDELVDLPAGAMVTFSATATAPDPLTEILPVDAAVTPPAGWTDTDPADNTATADVRPRDIFADGFESGETTAWTTTVGGDT